ncbi:MAG: SLC13 family permease, partial [Gemmatimonadota bacterium]
QGMTVRPPPLKGLARRLRVSPAALLLPVVMAANIGGTSTLIGDPPNIMIGSGANLTFLDFLINLAPPVLVMMFGLEFIARRWFATDLAAGVAAVADPNASTVMVTDPGLLRQLAVICGFVLIGFLTHGITGMPAAVPATVGAGAALLVQDIRYLQAHRPSHEERVHGILDVLEHQIEWATLVFFAFLFIVVGAAVETGLIGSVAHGLEVGIEFGQTTLGLGPQGVLLFAAILILWVSGVASALIDNIPFVAVSIPVIREIIPTLPGDAGVLWWALALGACLGGNGTPVGASANVTTLDLMAREGTRISFAAFTRFGATVAGFTLVVSCIWLTVHIFVGAQETMLGTLAVGLAIGAFRMTRRAS